MFNPTVYTLPNGLKVVVIEDHLSPVVTQMVWYKVGAADEDDGHSGIAHFLGSILMFKGTPTVGPGEFSKIIARTGGEDNAFTDYDYTAYFQTIRADRLELVMKLESDRMRNLKLTDDQVYPERDVIVEERRQRIDSSPESRLDEALRYMAFVNSPYGRDVIGWQQEMQQLTTADAIAWYKKWYTPSNAVLIVVGDVKPAEDHEGAGPGNITARSRRIRSPNGIAHKVAPLAGTERRLTRRDPDIHEPAFVRLYVAPNYSAKTRKDALALEVFDEIFGTGTTSRLYQALAVKAKISTGAGMPVRTTTPRSIRCAFGIYATPAPGKDIADVEKAVEGEVKRVLKDGVTDAEVADAKTRLQAEAILARDEFGQRPGPFDRRGGGHRPGCRRCRETGPTISPP